MWKKLISKKGRAQTKHGFVNYKLEKLDRSNQPLSQQMKEKPSTFNKMSVENPIWSRCVPLHYPAVYFHTALIHITVSQWNPAGGRDVRGIFPQPKPRAKTSRGEEEKKNSKFKTDWTTKSRKLERFGDLPRSWRAFWWQRVSLERWPWEASVKKCGRETSLVHSAYQSLVMP